MRRPSYRAVIQAKLSIEREIAKLQWQNPGWTYDQALKDIIRRRKSTTEPPFPLTEENQP